MKKKKLQVMICCLSMWSVLSLSACGSSGTETKNIVGETENERTDSDLQEVEEEAKSGATGENISIENQVLVDQDGIVITATEYVVDEIWGDGIKLLIENNTQKDVTVGCDALIVNDYMITDLFASDVAAGKKANETVNLMSHELEAAGIDTVGKIEIDFHIYDSATYDNLFEPAVVEIQTSAYANMDTLANDDGTELYNEGGIRIVGKTVDENSFWGTAILLFIENTSDRNVSISCDDMSIDGFMMTPYFSSTVYAGKKAVDDITIMSSELEENGVTSIDTVELEFKIYDKDSYDTIAESGPITFSAK